MGAELSCGWLSCEWQSRGGGAVGLAESSSKGGLGLWEWLLDSLEFWLKSLQ